MQCVPIFRIFAIAEHSGTEGFCSGGVFGAVCAQIAPAEGFP